MRYYTEVMNDRGGWFTDGQSKDLRTELDRRRHFLLNNVAARVVDDSGRTYTEKDMSKGSDDRWEHSIFSARNKKRLHLLNPKEALNAWE